VIHLQITVIKKDGHSEQFSRDKLTTAITKVGVSTDVAAAISLLVETWLTGSLKEEVSSMDIRYKVIDLLKMVNPIQAAVYESHKKLVN
jgi:transcriptional regulator NrdR family protein